MRFGSLFAGVGGFDIGLEAAGWQCGWQVEWDAHCQQVLAHHWPNVPRWWDVSDVNGAELPPVDVITFGSPCQDLSVAGKRAGLVEGGRSNLFFQATRIIREMKEKTNGQYPRIAIWENVPGALSSNHGDDFEAVLREMADLGSYHLEWSVLDAQFFGVPQRRRRVFVIAVLDPAIAERSGGQILVVGQSRRRNTTKGKSTRKNAPANVATSIGSGGPWWDGGEIADALTATSNEQRMPDKNRLQVVIEPATLPIGEKRNIASRTTTEIVGTLQARDYKGVGNQYVNEHKLIIESE
jgi:DNA (cytosine-5)-methyltransferase 1